MPVPRTTRPGEHECHNNPDKGVSGEIIQGDIGYWLATWGSVKIIYTRKYPQITYQDVEYDV